MATKLTEADAKRADPPATGYRVLWDSEVRGFGLRVSAGGAKAFVLNYRIRGRERRLTIGRYPDDHSVKSAREAAKGYRRRIRDGEDPQGERHVERSAPTIEGLAERYRTEHLPTKAPKSRREDEDMLRQFILPALGKLKVADVKQSDIARLHRSLSDRPYRANRVLALLNTMFNQSVDAGDRAYNPCKKVKKYREQPRERYLTAAELRRLFDALADHPDRVGANVVRLLALTGCRRGEALAAKWADFDLETGVWHKPASGTKQRRVHRVPLSPPAVDLLRQVWREHGGREHVFPSERKPNQPREGVRRVWSEACEAAGLDDVRVHDLRHSYASLLASSGESLQVIGALLGHSNHSTTQRYAHLLDDTLRQATERAGEAVTGGNVVPMKRGA